MNQKVAKEEAEMEIDLLSLFLFLLQKWKVFLLVAVAGGILAAGITYIQPAKYESTSTLYVLSKTTSITSVADLQLGSELTSDFTEIATSKPVIDTAIKQLKEKGIILTREEVRNMMSVANKTDTRMLTITVTSEDASLSYELGEALTSAAVDQMASITQTDPPTIVERPEIADEPNDNGMVKNIAIGILLGIVLVGACYTVVFLLNDRIQTEEDVVAYLELSVLGMVPVDKTLEQHGKSEEKDEKRRKKKKHRKMGSQNNGSI